MCKFQKSHASGIARVILAAMILGAASRSSAQSPVEHLAFDRPEAWVLRYFAAVSTFTGLGPPVARIYVESLRTGDPVVLPEESLRAGRAMYEKLRRRPR